MELHTALGRANTFGDLSAFSGYWTSDQNPNKGVPRAVAHALTSPVFGGVAQSVGRVCSKVTGYAISSVYGSSFPYPVQHTNGGNWDLFVFAHENGHVYGSRHTLEHLPPIKCNDGSGPDQGTIMSYCHQSFGVGGVGMRFHERVQDTMQDTMRGLIAGKTCQQVIQLIRGDYTMDGLVDAADIAELDAYVAQGFVSRGAQRAFDFDNNGVVDSVDRDVLVLRTQGAIRPAFTTFRNGSGTNCPWCFTELTPALIGSTWTTYVGSYFGDPVLTMVVGATAPLDPGVPTPFGELLIGVSGFGGQTVFQNVLMTNGLYAQHDIPIPPMASLTGLTLYTQAALFAPGATPLTNALDLFLVPF